MENVPDAGRVVGNPEVFFNYFGDPLKRPQLGQVAMLARPFQQQCFQPAYLLVRQTGLAPRRAVSLKKSLAKRLIGFFPVADGPRTGTDKTGDLLGFVALFQQRNGFSPTLLSCCLGFLKVSCPYYRTFGFVTFNFSKSNNILRRKYCSRKPVGNVDNFL